MIKELITKETICFKDRVDSWEEAIRIGAEPLIKTGSINPGYVDDIIDNVNKHGPYIVITPGFALSHAKSDHVNSIGMSYLRLDEPVNFLDREDRSATVILTLAACDNTSHLDALKELSKILMDEACYAKFLNCKTSEEVIEVIGQVL